MFEYAIQLLEIELTYMKKMPNEFKNGIKQLQQAISLLEKAGKE